MNTIIKQIIEADKKARLEVASAKEKFEQLNRTLNHQQDLKAYYEKSLNDLLEAKTKELELAYQEEFDSSKKAYTQALERLESEFVANREKWIRQIVDQCFEL